MTDKDKYAYRVVWSEEDGAYIGTVAEFPSLSHIDDSLGKAFCGIVDLVGDVLEEMEESGEMPPEPFSERRFSGKLPLRITPEQHRKLATEAACAGVSINRLIASKL